MANNGGRGDFEWIEFRRFDFLENGCGAERDDDWDDQHYSAIESEDSSDDSSNGYPWIFGLIG
jgi:hypothetical protein